MKSSFRNAECSRALSRLADYPHISGQYKADIILGCVARMFAWDTHPNPVGTPRECIERLVSSANEWDTRREREQCTRKEKKGHVDPTLECPRCKNVGSCISKQVHDRLGGDEGASRYILCQACNAVTKSR